MWWMSNDFDLISIMFISFCLLNHISLFLFINVNNCDIINADGATLVTRYSNKGLEWKTANMSHNIRFPTMWHFEKCRLKLCE